MENDGGCKMIDLRLGDCLELMKEVPKQRMLLTDIPYEKVSRNDNGLRNLNKDKADVKTFELYDFLNLIYDKADIFVIFCGNEQYSTIYDFFVDKQKKWGGDSKTNYMG